MTIQTLIYNTCGVKNTPKIAIFKMCYGENGTVKFLETLADNVCRHIYSMMQI